MTTLKEAIVDLLADDDTYRSLVGYPAGYPYKVYYLRPPEVERPDLPLVVFNFGPSAIDQNQDRPIIAYNVQGNFMVWSVDGQYEEIADRVIYLLHHGQNSAGIKAVLSGQPEDLYDQQTNAYGKLIRFDIHYRSTII